MLKGTINKKTINGKEYYIHQYREDGVMRNKSLDKDEAYSLSFKINYSKKYDLEELENRSFSTMVQFGFDLYTLLNKYRAYKHRFLFDDIHKFLFDDTKFGKVLALYGLRRTGKTTLIFQNILDMSLEDFSKCAYIKIKNSDTFERLMNDLNFLTTHGFKYIFIDEITLLNDFNSLASVLSDIYGLRSKIVLSGTDSLGFMISKYHELYDRIILIHTTYIPYKEFSEVLDIDSIDTYIEYGGLMAVETNNYNETKFIDGESINEYVDTAIAHNIEHSLKYYQDGEHFHSLYALYEKGELTNVINRLIEDTNHRFAISVIEASFKSHDYGSLKNLLKKNKDEKISSSLDDVNEEEIIKTLMNELNIINKEKQTYKIDENVIQEIDQYLNLLDLCKDIDVISSPSFKLIKRKVFIQPGLRFAQAKTLLNILMNQASIRLLTKPIKDFITEKLLSDIKGKILEEIVLYQTSINNKDTFKFLFPIGEYDMVTLNNQDRSANIYEIKYSKEINEKQYRFLNDDKLNDIVEQAYYPINEKIVLYRGDTQNFNGIKYLNIEEYLKSL